MMSQLSHFFGLDNAAGPNYLFWSGIGISPLAWFWLAVAYYRHHNCHTHHCWRLQRKAVPGTAYVVCRKHHPRPEAPTHAQILADHRKVNEEKNG